MYTGDLQSGTLVEKRVASGVGGQPRQADLVAEYVAAQGKMMAQAMLSMQELSMKELRDMPKLSDTLTSLTEKQVREYLEANKCALSEVPASIRAQWADAMCDSRLCEDFLNNSVCAGMGTRS
jgi:hypothetical protein